VTECLFQKNPRGSGVQRIEAIPNTRESPRQPVRIPGFILVLVIFASLTFATQGNCANVRGWEGTIDFPTYALGQEDPNPPFPLVNHRQIYPYTMMDDLTDRREMKTYKAIYLENDYLKAIILPEIGGRLYSLYDKVSKREVFYRNNVVKYGLVGLRGAWISGGIEFNFPNGHTVVTVSHVASRLLANPDGSATAIVGGMDWVTGMHWEVALTLRPHQARLEQHVTLFNSTPLDHLYWYWANAAVPATEDMQFVYPMREVNPHSRTEIWNYPVSNGVDYSWYKNIRQPTSLFGRGIHKDFFGAYYHDSDFGIVHVADWRELPGKKIWSWGVADDGLIWTDLLTDHDGAYNEIQSGRYETQLNQEFLPPLRVESWTEYWYPVHGLGSGFVEATSEFAMNANFVAGTGSNSPLIELAINPTVNIQGARIRVAVGGSLFRELGPVSFSATTTHEFSVRGANTEEARKSLSVDIVDANSRTLLHWSRSDPVDGNKDFVPAAGVHEAKEKPLAAMTAEELYLRGVEEEKDGQPEAAAKTYEQVLQREPSSAPALLKLAYRDYDAANLDAAQQEIDRALMNKSSDPTLLYAAGLIRRAARSWVEAASAFSASLKADGPSAPAQIQLGEISIREKKYEEAAERFRQVVNSNPENALAFADLAVALRLEGKPADAAKAADQAVDLMPLLPFALVEEWRCQSALGAAGSISSKSSDTWKNVLNFDDENYLEVAAWYRSVGDWDSSDAVLEEAVKDFPARSISPLVYYYLASNAREEGNSARAAEYSTKAASANYDKVFPQRLSDFKVLADALSYNPEDAHAHYFCGTFLFAHGRYEDAAKEWLKAKKEGFENPVLERDLGIYAGRMKNNLREAAAYYERAISLAPSQYRYYPELDEIYAQLGETAKRDQLFARAPIEVLDRDTVRVRRALLYVQEGEFQNALALLNDHHFKPWEGGAIVRQIFVFANLTYGKTLLGAKRLMEAEDAFRRALDYPTNLGVGKPDRPHDEEVWYWLGVALAAEGNSREAQDAWNTAAKEGETTGGVPGVFAAAALMKLGQDAEAERLLAAASAIADQPAASAHSLFVAGLAEQLRNHQPEAQKDFRRALKLDPLLWQARYELDRSTGAAKIMVDR
jgi:tetratricopeptide (TPR) repeat protein